MANRIREARERAGLTQQQIADSCRVSEQAVSAWETGRAKQITGTALFCLADALGVPARWIVNGGELDSQDTLALDGLSAGDKQAIRELAARLRK